jgi:steroid 5-alpha reductase family enzyme
MILLGYLFMAIVMTVLWQVQRRSGDAGIVDVAWGLGVAVIAVVFALWTDQGNTSRRVAVAVVALVWALRLSGYVLRRVLTLPEDGRYQTLKEQWGGAAQVKMLQFYQMQAAASVLFALPMLIAMRSEAAWSLWDTLGCVVGLVAIAGESWADWQLSAFRAKPENKGKVCQQGLWRYSRHPNYFFEWVHWWAYVCFAPYAPWGWLTLLFPLTMYYFITQKTGIPPTEEQALKSRGDAYRQYQRTTSAFFPWFPKGV